MTQGGAGESKAASRSFLLTICSGWLMEPTERRSDMQEAGCDAVVQRSSDALGSKLSPRQHRLFAVLVQEASKSREGRLVIRRYYQGVVGFR